MSKSREFDNALDECLERLLVKGETIEQCLKSFPEHADELKSLLETALSTKQVSSIQPRSEFRDKARYQFYSALQEMEHKKRRPFFSWGWQPRWATVVAIVLALLLACGGGTVATASGSMPDDLLYPVKLATEQVQLTFTFSDIGKAELNAKLADKRVAEIVYLASEGNSEKIELTAQRLDGYLTEIADLSSTQEVMVGVAVTPEVEETPAVEEAATAEEVPEEARAVEEELGPKEATAFEEVPIPEDATAFEEVPIPEDATAFEEVPGPEDATAFEEVPIPEDATAFEEVPGLEKAGRGKEAPVKVDRRAKLKKTMERQANNNTARLRALLQTASASARPALLHAIAVSENGYKKALKALD